MARTIPISIKTLREKSDALNKKHKIDSLETEIDQLFSPLGITLHAIHDSMRNAAVDQVHDIFKDNEFDHATCTAYIVKFNDIKKKYKYESYLRAGRTLRDKFIKSRKNNPINIIKLDAKYDKKSTNIAKINLLYLRQYIFAVGLDRVLKMISPQPVTIKYEDLDGKVKSVRVVYRKSTIDEATMDVEAPLIDRTVGETLFDSFFLHSFYDIEHNKWCYIPVELIQKIEGLSKETFLKGFQNGSF